MQSIIALLFLLWCMPAVAATAGTRDTRGFIDVFALRQAVSRLESKQPHTYKSECADKDCVRRAAREKRRFEAASAKFMSRWGPALLSAIRRGDEVAEVIWRQCTTTPVIDRTALASTCDPDPARQAEALARLRQIGFEAALQDADDPEFPSGERDHRMLRDWGHPRTLARLSAGVFGRWSWYDFSGGNTAGSPRDLDGLRRAAAINTAYALVRRSFTYRRRQGSSEQGSPHARLALDRGPMGAPGLAWSANLFAGTSPRTGMFDPLVYIHGEEVFLHYGGRDVVMVGDRHDALYLRTLHDTLAGAEKRIDAWLARDRRWSVFLLQRRGHHEWVPAGMASAFGPVRPAWHGTWSLEKRFVDFRPAPIDGEPVLRVRRSGGQTVAQFEAGGTAPYACELRYSGANSLAPDGASSTVLGSVTGLTDAGFPTTEAAFAPLDPRKRYRQVLVQCPQGEWPDNRTVRFFFIARDVLVEVYRGWGSGDLAIRHWRRVGPLRRGAPFVALAPQFDLRETLTALARDAAAAEAVATRKDDIRRNTETMDARSLIASLAILRWERSPFYSRFALPDNVRRLIEMPGVALDVCAAYRQPLPDPIQRFNLMVVLNKRAESLSPEERAVVPDCLREALRDEHAWVRLEAVDAMSRYVEEQDRTRLQEMLQDQDEDVRRYAGNALIRLGPGESVRERSPGPAMPDESP
jgi:hypothetical protein